MHHNTGYFIAELSSSPQHKWSEVQIQEYLCITLQEPLSLSNHGASSNCKA